MVKTNRIDTKRIRRIEGPLTHDVDVRPRGEFEVEGSGGNEVERPGSGLRKRQDWRERKRTTERRNTRPLKARVTPIGNLRIRER